MQLNLGALCPNWVKRVHGGTWVNGHREHRAGNFGLWVDIPLAAHGIELTIESALERRGQA